MVKAIPRLGGFALLILALAGAAGCSIGGESSGAGMPSVKIVQRDFRITAPKRLPAGPVELSVKNRGPDAHELAVIRSTGGRLPLRADGITVDEDAIEAETAAELEPRDPGVHELKANLQPGRYVLICNMSGHYMGGMHTRLVVQ